MKEAEAAPWRIRASVAGFSARHGWPMEVVWRTPFVDLEAVADAVRRKGPHYRAPRPHESSEIEEARARLRALGIYK